MALKLGIIEIKINSSHFLLLLKSVFLIFKISISKIL